MNDTTPRGDALATAPKRLNLKTYLSDDKIKAKFNEVLGDKAQQFLSALVQIGSQDHLRNCSPQSIAASAMTAATLDLPIQASLGFAWIVPYKGDAVFQIGWKGVVQLALRSGQFHRINAGNVNEEAYKGRDDIGEPVIDWDALDDTKEPIGYYVAWRLTNGFTKVAYWTLPKVEAHAQKYSQSYRGQRNSPWKDKDQFHAMALKTVVKNELSRWAPLSVKMQEAFSADHSRRKDIDSPYEPIDIDPAGNRLDDTAEEGAPEFREPEAKQQEKPQEVAPPAPLADAELYRNLNDAMQSSEVTLAQVIAVFKACKWIRGGATIMSVEELPPSRVGEALGDWERFAETAKML